MSKHVFNIKKDAPAKDPILAPKSTTAPLLVSFRGQVPFIKDQGQAGSCAAHAGTELMELLYRMHPSLLAKRIDVTKLRFSPEYLYAKIRMMEGTFGQDAGDQDSRTIFRVLAREGCCTEADDPYSDTPAALEVAPTAAQDQEAAIYKIGAYHRIPDVETAKTVLYSGYSFTVGMPVFEQMESDQAAADGCIAVPDPSELPIGGHEMHIIGANDSKKVLNWTGAFEVQQSWGGAWGDHGFAWIPYDYFSAPQIAGQFDFWTAHFGKPWI